MQVGIHLQVYLMLYNQPLTRVYGKFSFSVLQKYNTFGSLGVALANPQTTKWELAQLPRNLRIRFAKADIDSHSSPVYNRMEGF